MGFLQKVAIISKVSSFGFSVIVYHLIDFNCLSGYSGKFHIVQYQRIATAIKICYIDEGETTTHYTKFSE